MSESKDTKRTIKVKKVSHILNEALINAMRAYKSTEGQLPDCGYHFHFTEGMTPGEELLEVFHALIRSGMDPRKAKIEAPKELEKIYAQIAMFDDATSDIEN